eukprot:TRINITY_DN557_c0_g1_i1.p1 TRINITY_DN557_c0_g1~~TRINITY_DN557_c0_g1_i1.p1  ORF type:complete len:525 (-),score=215.46 TRINITY_DN557_c0_g1_i1:25-1539(-)
MAMKAIKNGKSIFLIILILLISILFVQAQTPSFNIAEVDSFKLISQSQQSQLFEIQLKNGNNGYDDPILILNLRGSNFQRGYDYGYLLSDAIQFNFNSLVNTVVTVEWQQELIFKFLDDQWTNYLSKQVTSSFIEEIQGIAAASKDKKVPIRSSLDILVQRAIVLSNFPGDVVSNIIWLLYNQRTTPSLNRQQLTELLNNIIQKNNMQCSMFGVWGSRTVNKNLYSMRNLDWLPNAGISKYKLLTIYHEEGQNPYVTIGFAGLIGSLTGMSSKGITVHEAGNDVTKETFDGFTWTLRLRAVMAQAYDLQSAMQFWNSTNNTLGMNHGIGSSSDGKFLCLETMANYTAVFSDNDPREANYKVINPDTQIEYQLGEPLVDAVWRTNHGFDPVIVSFETSPPTSPTQDSPKRYSILHDSFDWYSQQGILIGSYQAINITSILGDKGPDFFSCENNKGGINILSVTYDPNNLEMYVAFEQGGVGTPSVWKPACCGTYVHIDMKSWFSS